MHKIYVLRIAPQQLPVKCALDSSLEGLQRAVGGNVDIIYPFDDPICLLIDEEGKIKKKDFCRALTDENGRIYDVIAGTFYVAGLDTDDNLRSLTEEEVKKYSELFGCLEYFKKVNGKISTFRLRI